MAQTNNGTVPLEQTVDFSLGGDWGKSPNEKLEGYIKVKVVRGTEFANWSNDKTKTAALRQIKKSSFEKRKLKKGDLVVEVSGGGPKQPVGRVIVIDDEALSSSDYPLVCSNFFRQIRLKDGYVPEFVGLSIYKDYLLGKIDAFQTSSTNIRNLNFGDFLANVEILDLTVAEQQGIANKLLNTLNIGKDTEERLQRSKSLLKKFRQSVLTDAITGKLTEVWRERNINLPKASINYVKQNNKPKVQFGLSQFETYDLPEGWEWKQFWEAAEIKSNLVKPDKYPDYVLVAPDNIERNTGRLLEKKLVKEIKPISAKHLFFNGQIVYSKIRPYLSKLILADFDGLCSADMYPISPRINVRYLMLFMLSKYFLDNVSNLGTRTLLPKTNQEELNSIPIPVPSLEEQEAIVAKVDAYLSIAQKVEEQIGKAEARVSKLTQAVLAKTFRQE